MSTLPDHSYNETNIGLFSIAKNRAKEKQVNNINWQQYDWRVIASKIEAKFDAVLALGNFLSLIHDYKDRRRCLDQFFKILNPGGILIIDERNFTRILENQEEIVSNNKNPDLFYRKFYNKKEVVLPPLNLKPDHEKFMVI